LDFGGFSVTIPHKEHAKRFVEEQGGPIDEPVRRIGSVNTLVIGPEGKLSAYNTDAPAFLDEICALCGVAPEALRGKTVAVLGAGGMARAAVRTLRDTDADVTIFNRTDQAADSLAKETGTRWKPWSERVSDKSWLLVNCTSAGVADSESPMAQASLKLHQFVFDAVYRTGETQLVRDAKSAGVSAVCGLGMLLRQAAAQFHIWTGMQLSIKSIAESLNNHYSTP
jgi:shikimate dehydrogenase